MVVTIYGMIFNQSISIIKTLHRCTGEELGRERDGGYERALYGRFVLADFEAVLFALRDGAHGEARNGDGDDTSGHGGFGLDYDEVVLAQVGGEG